jgi:hypothetical protein
VTALGKTKMEKTEHLQRDLPKCSSVSFAFKNSQQGIEILEHALVKCIVAALYPIWFSCCLAEISSFKKPLSSGGIQEAKDSIIFIECRFVNRLKIGFMCMEFYLTLDNQCHRFHMKCDFMNQAKKSVA